MRDTHPLLLLLLATLLLTACAGHNPRALVLDQADSLMTVNPDSAYRMLVAHADDYAQPDNRPLASLSPFQSQRMRYQLLLAEAMNKTDRPFTSDSVGRELTQYYDHWLHGNANLRMRAYYMLGCAYRDMGSAPRALENYEKAASYADTSDARCDLNVLMRIHSQMAGLFLKQRLPEPMEKELHIAIRLAEATGDRLSKLALESTYCYVLYNNKEYQECIAKSILLHDKLLQNGYNNEALLAYADCINSYIALKDYTNAKKYLDLYETCSYFQEVSERVVGGIGSLYILKGNYFLGIVKEDSAEYYFQQALPYINLGSNRLLTYKGLYQTYALQGKTDSLIKYTQLYSEAKERSFNDGQTQASIQAKALYDYTREQNRAEQKAKDARISHYIILLLLTITIATGLLAIIAHKHNKQRRLARELEYRKVVEEHMNTQILVQQQKELINTYQLDVQKKNEQLNEEPIVKLFRAMAIGGYNGKIPIKKEWTQLERAFNRYMPHMYARMQVARLSQRETFSSILTFLGFSSQELVTLIDTTPSIVSNLKSSANYKLFGDKSATTLQKNLKKCVYFQA